MNNRLGINRRTSNLPTKLQKVLQAAPIGQQASSHLKDIEWRPYQTVIIRREQAAITGQQWVIKLLLLCLAKGSNCYQWVIEDQLDQMGIKLWSLKEDQAVSKASGVLVALRRPSFYQGQLGTGHLRKTKLLLRLVSCWSPQEDQVATKASGVLVALSRLSCYQGQLDTGCLKRPKLLQKLVGYWLPQEDQAATKAS